jgi:hypothetical protein
MQHHTMIESDGYFLKQHERFLEQQTTKLRLYEMDPDSKNWDEKKKEFMNRTYSPIITKYARLMNDIAPKCCEKCSKPLRVPELAWRLAYNIDNFFCYECIGALEKQEARLEHNGRGMWTLSEKIKEE